MTPSDRCRPRFAASATPTASCGRSSGSTSRSATHEVVGLVGPSGCGKSTLLELICGLREPSAGEIAVGGADGARRAASPSCAYMPQRDLLLPWYSALDNAALALRNRGLGKAEARARAGGAVRALRPRRLRARTPRPSSRAGCASGSPSCAPCVAGKPVLALDEPFASLDAITRAEMQEWLAAALRRRPAHGRPRHPRRRGGALPLRPRRRALRPPGPDRRRAARPRPARARPRRRRHRPRLRRRPRAGAAGPARGLASEAPRRRCRRPAAGGADRRLAARRLDRLPRRRARARKLPRPLAGGNRRIALGEPLAAGRKRLGDPARDPPRPRLRARRRGRLRRADAPLGR